METVPAAEGPYMVAIAKLAEMFAACDSVQERFQCIGSSAGALRKIYFPAVDELDIPARMPLVVLGPGDNWDWDLESAGGKNYLRPQGSIMVLFADKSKYEDTEAAQRDFGNWVGNTFKDLEALAGVSANVAIKKIRQQFPPSRCPKEHEASFGRYYLAGFFIDWE